jgi:antitoxin VapB
MVDIFHGTIHTLSTYPQEVKMLATAKLFITGRSQAVRLPREFRFQGTEVFIRRDSNTGEVVLSAKPASWQEFFELADRTEIPPDFLADREDLSAEERTLF